MFGLILLFYGMVDFLQDLRELRLRERHSFKERGKKSGWLLPKGAIMDLFRGLFSAFPARGSLQGKKERTDN